MRNTVSAFAFRIITAFLFAQLVSRAGVTTNFTGDWKVSIQKSDFGPLFAPKAAQVKID